MRIPLEIISDICRKFGFEPLVFTVRANTRNKPLEIENVCDLDCFNFKVPNGCYVMIGFKIQCKS